MEDTTDLGENGTDLVKSSPVQTAFGRGCDEDIEENINVFQDICDICDMNPSQKRWAMMKILKVPARAYFVKHVRDAQTYEKGTSQEFLMDSTARTSQNPTNRVPNRLCERAKRSVQEW